MTLSEKLSKRQIVDVLAHLSGIKQNTIEDERLCCRRVVANLRRLLCLRWESYSINALPGIAYKYSVQVDKLQVAKWQSSLTTGFLGREIYFASMLGI